MFGLLLVGACAQVANEPAATATPTTTQPATESPESGLELTRPATVSATPSQEPDRTRPSITKTTASPSGTDPEATTRFFVSPDYGVQAFLWWDPNIAKRDLEAINTLDFNWVKQSFAWRDIEPIEKGKYDWYRPDLIVEMIEEAGLDVLVRIDRQPFWSQEEDWPPLENAPPADLQDFAEFCGILAERFRGRIAAYQVWNEPNLSREWGDDPPSPAEYTELLKVCYEAIKESDPQAIVVSAGLAPTGTGLPLAMPDVDFLEGMYEAGAAEYFDVLGINAPGYKAPPEVSPEEGEANPDYGGGRWFVFRHVEDIRQVMVANGDADKQVSILELGWTTDGLNPNYAWHAVTEEQQADYLVRAYHYAVENWQPWMGPMFTIYIADPDWTAEENEQWWWAITYPDGSKRPAYKALQEMDKVFGQISD